MERDGWIQRRSCQVDRRKKFLSLTPKVEPIWETITTASRRVRAQAAQGLPDARVQQLIAELAGVRGRVSPGEPGTCRPGDPTAALNGRKPAVSRTGGPED